MALKWQVRGDNPAAVTTQELSDVLMHLPQLVAGQEEDSARIFPMHNNAMPQHAKHPAQHSVLKPEAKALTLP
jgi:hypothetical protein